MRVEFPSRRKAGDSSFEYAFQRREKEERETAALPLILPDQFALLSKQGQATPEHARSCVYHLKNDLQIKPLSQRGSDSEAGHVGGRVLHWLWGQDMNVRDELSLDRIFVERLSYFLVAEGREEFLWKWLLHELATTKRRVNKPGRHLWVPGIMNAQREFFDSVVPPLRTLHRALEDFSGRRLWPMTFAAAVAGQIMITSNNVPPYDPALFTVVLRANEAGKKGPVLRYTQAAAMLFHPTQPNARFFLNETSEYLKLGINTARDAAQNAFAAHVLRAAYIFRLQNNAKDAAWLEAIVKTRFPVVWAAREKKRLTELETDPKLEVLRRQYTGQAPPTFDPWS
ncbi:hypothetical protein CB0940_06658 [Cercospora beticola]|uniref:Uncharacterized protein n=1 Tax=Cercospora beticola TaxID=122368 RepID=A0A2G5HYV5_CERBT|nr:hypothetical protein CB0940_06658 [Cercospora beticola]PIA97724.1 hypothetical protein CB0940_06658 [Cercospora beticola]WPA99319.1 hypothetical protein RHO25_003936 [Cercospora beticola]CAK1360643.1 unnamed protein product [Cercospora beticola]